MSRVPKAARLGAWRLTRRTTSSAIDRALRLIARGC
jgi:hypothetical protein